MIIIEDSRQQAGKHEIKHASFTESGDTLIRCKLPFGDYSLPPAVSVDTKQDMEEICSNICGSAHNRFKRECIAARDAGCQLIILTENNEGISSIDDVHKWINPQVIYHQNAAQGPQLEKAMRTMQGRYGVLFMFCTPEDSASMIKKLLKEYDHGRKKPEEGCH